jgi:hypothetical protein
VGKPLNREQAVAVVVGLRSQLKAFVQMGMPDFGALLMQITAVEKGLHQPVLPVFILAVVAELRAMHCEAGGRFGMTIRDDDLDIPTLLPILDDFGN